MPDLGIIGRFNRPRQFNVIKTTTSSSKITSDSPFILFQYILANSVMTVNQFTFKKFVPSYCSSDT